MKRSTQFIEAIDAYDAGHEEKALRLMEECARKGDPVACYMAALWHGNGEAASAGLSNRNYWIECLKHLAEQNNVEAQWELSCKLRWGNLLPLNIKCANYWLERSAEGGFGDAQHHLAWYFETGQYDYPVDMEKAEKWYQLAFQQENPETLYLFATRQFHNGKPTEESIKLLRIAAEKGFIQAVELLRSCTH